MIYPSTESNISFPTIDYAEGCYAYDVSGNKYLDFNGGNNTVVLGHNKINGFPAPNYPGKSIYEEKLSELLFERLGNRSMFRFFKNGTDAVSCSIRLAKNILKNKSANIFFIGYAGSNNEYVSTLQTEGMEYIEDMNSAQIVFDDNIGKNKINIDDFLSKNIEPDILVYESRFSDTAKNIKAKIKIQDHLKSGILGIDEEKSDIDLYGKSISNGLPLSIMTAKDKYMEQINGIYYSTTFGGENIGLVGAISTILTFDSYKYSYLKKLDIAKSILPKWQRIDNDKRVRFWKDHKILFNGHWQLMVPHTIEDIMKLKKACEYERVI